MNSDRIADLSAASPQRTVLQSHPKTPAARSTLYLTRSVTDNAAGGRHHTIVGVHIVLAAGEANGLWAEFHIDRSALKLDASRQKEDDEAFLMATRSLTICCDTLEVHGGFCVPEADVTIHARRLVWATGDAGIDTSPLAWDLPKASDAAGTTPGANGANGRSAGSLRVFVAEVESSGDARPRFTANGGRGQDPGEGLDGKPGQSRPPIASAQFLFRQIPGTDVLANRVTVPFSPPAVYVGARWWGGGVIPIKSDPRGVDSCPTSGTAALAPGIPGNGGNGGRVVTNSPAVLASAANGGGAAGSTPGNCTGGPAGTPTLSAMYELDIYLVHALKNPNHTYTLKKTRSCSTRAGSGAEAKPAPDGPGSKPEPVLIECANAWLHPLALQTVLEFARDLFLAEARAEVLALLQDYEEALALPLPPRANGWDDGPWADASPAQWTAAQTELASILQRLRAHLDYFGNPAGYTPLLSLQGAIKLYEGETRRALRTMLLADRVASGIHDAEETVAILGDVIDGMNEDSARAAEQVTAAERTIGSLTGELDGLEQQLQSKGNELAAKRTELLGRAETTKEQQAIVKFSIKMAGAICQVVPCGQPVLGAVGSLAGVGADLIGGDPEGVPDTVSRMGDVIAKAREAARKAAEASKKADQAKPDADRKEGKDAKAAGERAAATGKALDGLGPAVSQFSGALSALQVPRAEIEAELQRLESECPELQQLLAEIGTLNDTKAELFGRLAGAFQSLGDACARLSSNAAAVVGMQQQKAGALGRIDHEAGLFVRQVAQRSRLSLLKYLYFMVKAYETTLLQPLDVDWELSRVTAKIDELLKDGKAFDGGTLEDEARTLDGLFQQNLDVVRRKLLEDASGLGEVTMTRTLVLSSTQSPERVAALNRAGHVTLDPFEHGLVDPRTQLARLSDAELASVEFDPEGPALPEGGQLVVDLIPARDGTLRRNETLCAVTSDAPVRWNWTCSGGRVEKSPPSRGAEDLLDFILGEGSERVRQKIARPPFWSRLSIRVRYLPGLADKDRPRITRLYFTLKSDVSPAPDRQCVLMVHPQGPSAGTVVECAPEDLAGRAAGFGHFMRIYNRGAELRLKVPAAPPGACFERWQLIGAGRPDVDEPDTGAIRLDDDVIAQCCWVRARDRVERFDLIDSLDPAQLAALAESCADGTLRKAFRLHAEARAGAGLARAAAPGIGRMIRVEARDDAPVVGCIPPGEEAELLQDGEGGWQEVNYRGIAGWVR